MSDNVYKPEGSLIGTAENREYTASAAGLERAAASGKILEGIVTLCDSEMSLTVSFGNICGIIPREEVAYTPCGEEIKDIAIITRVGKAVCFKVINTAGGEIILSRRAAQLDCMREYLSSLVCGDIIPARVTHLEHFGAFCDIGCGIISLLSIDCISVSRISHPADRFTVGMPIMAAVKSIDRETGRVYITHKELLGTWQENADLFCAGQTACGIVRSVESYGIFIELAPNLAGLAEYRNGAVVGQTAAVYIKSIIPERMKIKLVIIDFNAREAPALPPKYFFTGNHMDSFTYSPDSCERVIETVFARD